MPSPLRPPSPGMLPEDPDYAPTSYEAMLISALLDSGSFTPEVHHVDASHIIGWSKLWDTAIEYQQLSGTAPPLTLIARMYPEFRHFPKIDVAWAAAKVLEEAASRDLRARTMTSLKALAEGDLDEAYNAFENLVRPRGHHKAPADLFDASRVIRPFDRERIEVPYPSLRRMLRGGLEHGEYLILAARLAQGKSHVMCRFMSSALAAGWRCACISLEMPARQVNLRTLKHLAGSDKGLFDALSSPDEIVVKKAVAQLAEHVPGHLDVFDPSFGSVGTTSMVHELARDYDAVYIDHLGLMKTANQKRAVEDWRVMSNISNVIREVTLETDTTVIGIAQVNRTGDRKGSMALPSPADLAQADALGQDATAVITMKRLSRHIMKYGLAKSREGDTGTFYSWFDPEGNRWEELPRDFALEQSRDDIQLDE
ncbi:MAG TPA: DnaB-like helicase C-terminal domain-containing protein [Microlunatus sp.]